MDFSDALNYLQEVRENGTKLSLENIKKIIDNLPFSLSKINFIQVAGTNGKGSTSHFITSILKNSGYKVGLFTSPHLQNIRERITINKEWIAEQEFADEIRNVKVFVDSLVSESLIENLPTFFEHLLLLALFYFHNNNVNFAVLEVGLGGRLDATTAVIPVLSIITNISLEHTKTLGKRIKDIATEKAGIAKRNVPLICGCKTNGVASRTIKAICDEKQAPFYRVFDKKNILSSEYKNDFFECVYKTEQKVYEYRVFMNGIHQTINAATAVKAIEIMNKSLDVSITEKAIKSGIKENFVPGRIEFIKGKPDIIIDGGHNTEGIKVLSKFLKLKGLNDLTLIFGVLRDKKFKKMIEMLLPFVKQIILLEPMSKRALPLDKMVKIFNNKKKVFKYYNDYKGALEFANSINKTILITGSIYMIGEIRNILFEGKDGH